MSSFAKSPRCISRGSQEVMRFQDPVSRILGLPDPKRPLVYIHPLGGDGIIRVTLGTSIGMSAWSLL